MQKMTAIYVRVSTLTKQDKGLKSQEEALLEYCQNHDIDNYKIYRDKQTGGTLDRPALHKLRQDIFRGRISTVIVWKLCRISRSLKDGVALLATWLEQGVRVIAVSQNFDFSGAVGQLISAVLLAVSQIERDTIRQNISRGMKAAAKRGVRIGGSKPKIKPQEATELKKQGKTISEIARLLKCSRQTVYSALKRRAEVSN